MPGVVGIDNLLAATVVRRRHHGVGLRYDLTQLLGLRVEYSRFNRFGGENVNAGLLPETDQVTLGVQFKF
jgi:opacity protein-like surface antigen